MNPRPRLPKSALENGGRRRKEAGQRATDRWKSLPRKDVPLNSRRRPTPVRVSRGDLRQPAIRIVMMPRDANYLGTIFGGVILSLLDLAGAVEGQHHSDHKLVTAAMREVSFIAPVFVGDLVSFYAEVLRLGRTSITVRVSVEALRAQAPHDTVRVTQADVVYVAIDESSKPRPLT
jgi:acyl-CoA thioesterase YciA